MPVWPALLLSPLLALAEQSVVYALSTPSCETQRAEWLHLLPPGFAAVTLAFTALAWIELRRQAREPHADADPAGHRAHFVAQVAVWSSALSTLAIVAMWVPQWWLSPCTS